MHIGAFDVFKFAAEDHRANKQGWFANERKTSISPKADDEQETRVGYRKTSGHERPKQGKRGYVDDEGRTWIKDRAHADVPDHWDVQINGGAEYIRIGLDGNEIV